MIMSAAYMAGMIDGDGCIYSARAGKGGKYLVARLTIANTSRALLEAISVRFPGGTIRFRVSKNPRWKPYGFITWTDTAAKAVLLGVLPFLILKRPQADLALELFAMKSGGRDRYDFVPDPSPKMPWRFKHIRKKSIADREDAIEKEFSRLNRRGQEATVDG